MNLQTLSDPKSNPRPAPNKGVAQRRAHSTTGSRSRVNQGMSEMGPAPSSGQVIDTRFLRMHPRTERWINHERDTCAKCVHCSQQFTAMNCQRTTRTTSYGSDMFTCMSARELPSNCGPEGKFFEPRQE